MLKVAFVGDSFSAYEQAGQQKNSWTYLLAKHFPQHTYFNYSLGGRGFDYYHMALLDAKIREALVMSRRVQPVTLSLLFLNPFLLTEI